jgi:hypothetical protein
MIGIGCGTQHFQLTLFATIVTSLIVFFSGNNKNKKNSNWPMIILRDPNAEIISTTMKAIKKKFPEVEVEHLRYGELSSEATIVLNDNNEGWLLEVKEKTGIKEISLVKR